jgi:hypothetical protein
MAGPRVHGYPTTAHGGWARPAARSCSWRRQRCHAESYADGTSRHVGLLGVEMAYYRMGAWDCRGCGSLASGATRRRMDLNRDAYIASPLLHEAAYCAFFRAKPPL